MGNYTQEIHFGGKLLVICGKNAKLDAKGKGSFFSYDSDDDDDGREHGKTSLELHDLVMQNGKTDADVSGF